MNYLKKIIKKWKLIKKLEKEYQNILKVSCYIKSDSLFDIMMRKLIILKSGLDKLKSL